MQRYLLLAVVAVLIGGSIWYLEGQKARPSFSGAVAGDIMLASTTVHSSQYTAHLKKFSPAKELVDPVGYINTPEGFRLADIAGDKVILIDFWTYSCINCQRTTPYLNAWYEKYKDFGFTIVGVHTPEFGFEKVKANVVDAVEKFGIRYPVVLDNSYATWDAYDNRYWPAGYLIDADGLVRERTIGEGNYEKTERAIQELLLERAKTLGTSQAIPQGFVDITKTIESGSPETYFGWSRNTLLGNGKPQSPGEQTLVLPQTPTLNQLYLGGVWNFSNEFARNEAAGAKIMYRYSAKSVYLVGSAEREVVLEVYVDGKLITKDKGADVDGSGKVRVKEARLYKLIESAGQEEHVLELRIQNAGLEAYTFTFG